jgi:hypothetical protein
VRGRSAAGVGDLAREAKPWQPDDRRAICLGMESEYDVQVVEQPDGRWIYRLVVVGADDPSAWESDGKSYLEREDAERAGRLCREAVAGPRIASSPVSKLLMRGMLAVDYSPHRWATMASSEKALGRGGTRSWCSAGQAAPPRPRLEGRDLYAGRPQTGLPPNVISQSGIGSGSQNGANDAIAGRDRS